MILKLGYSTGNYTLNKLNGDDFKKILGKVTVLAGELCGAGKSVYCPQYCKEWPRSCSIFVIHH